MTAIRRLILASHPMFPRAVKAIKELTHSRVLIWNPYCGYWFVLWWCITLTFGPQLCTTWEWRGVIKCVYNYVSGVIHWTISYPTINVSFPVLWWLISLYNKWCYVYINELCIVKYGGYPQLIRAMCCVQATDSCLFSNEFVLVKYRITEFWVHL